MGSFIELMTPVERLEVVDPTLPSRAHNDYLEILLEGGIFGIALIAAITICLIVMALKSWKSGSVTRAHGRFAFAAFFIIAAHSLVDYPFRSMSLAMLVGAAAGLLAPAGSTRGQSNAQ
jgi:O-antigen ligase